MIADPPADPRDGARPGDLVVPAAGAGTGEPDPGDGADAPSPGCELWSDFQQLEQIYLKTVEAYPDATIVTDRDGRILVFNTAAEFMFGYPREEVQGKNVELLVPADRRAGHLAGREEYFWNPRVIETGPDLEGLRRNGRRFPVQIKLAPMVVQGLGVCFLAVVRRVNKKSK